MSRSVAFAGAIWLAAAALFVVGAATGLFRPIADAYLCGWLVLISLPLGALPILMVLEAVGAGETAVAAPLRLLLASLPVLALLFVPVLVFKAGVYPWQTCQSAHCPAFHYQGFGATWFSHEQFALRSAIYLAIWFAFSLYYLRPAKLEGRRQALAVFGLMVHVVVGTLAAFDWFMSLDNGHVSSNYGLLVIAAQCAFAFTAALALSMVADQGAPSRRTLLTLVVVIGVATFAQFVEFLVVWSANLPKEIAWYQDRAAGGEVFTVAGPVLLVCAALALAPERAAATRIVCGFALGAFLLVELVDLMLLGSPNGLAALNILADMLAIVTIGGLAAVCAIVFGGRKRRRPAYG